MLAIHLKGVALADDVSFDDLARRTDGYSGADLQLACRDASMMPMRRAVEGKSPQEILELHSTGALEGSVGDEDFELALQYTQPSVNREELHAYVMWNKEYGCADTPLVGATSAKARPRPPRAPTAMPAPAPAPAAAGADADAPE